MVWFHGLDAAQIKAGPHRTEVDVKKARPVLKAAETRRNKISEKSQREQEIDWKLQRWHKRYKNGKKMNDSDDSDTDCSRFAPGGSGQDSDDDDDNKDSDDEPIAVEPSILPNRRQSVSSEESDGYAPPSSSDTESSESESKLPRSDSGIDLRANSRKKGSSSRFKAASDSEDSGPVVPVFSKSKAAQKARVAERSSTALATGYSVAPSSSEEEDVVLHPRRRRIVVDSNDDE